MQFAVYVLLLWLISGNGLDATRAVRKSSPGGCRCMTNQWEGSLISRQREFSWVDGRTEQRETTSTISYDFVHKLHAETDLDNGFKLISDYKNGVEYRVEPDGACRMSKLYTPMERMCIPENSIAAREYRIGLDNLVTVWEIARPGNHTQRMTVLKKLCIPLSEESLSFDDEYAIEFSTVYVNVTFGIRDAAVFQQPKNCVTNPELDSIDRIRALALEFDHQRQ